MANLLNYTTYWLQPGLNSVTVWIQFGFKMVAGCVLVGLCTRKGIGETVLRRVPYKPDGLGQVRTLRLRPMASRVVFRAMDLRCERAVKGWTAPTPG